MSIRQAIDRARHLKRGWLGAAPPRTLAPDAFVPGRAEGATAPTHAQALPLSEGARALVLRDADSVPAGSTYRGFVERADPAHGIVGWLIDLRDPFARLDVEIVVGGTVIDRIAVEQHRSDVWLSEDPTVTPGFVFAPELFHLIGGTGDGDALQIDVRPAGCMLSLTAATPLPTRSQVARWLGDETIAPPFPATTGLPLSIALARHQAVAGSHQGRSLRAVEASCIGFVEAFYPIDDQDVFISGWTRRAIRREQALMLVAEGRKHPAALIHVEHPRDDLEPGAMAFFGVLRADWRPASSVTSFFLFLGGEGDAWLRAHKPLRLLGTDEARERLQMLQATHGDPRLRDFHARLGRHDSWSLTPGAGTESGLFVGIDSVQLLPGFGAVFDGWVLSARAPLTGVELRLGGVVLELDPDARRIRPRRDLAGAFPRLLDRLDEAGFTGVLRGTLPVEHGGPALLRLTFADGSRMTMTIDPQAIRSIDHHFELRQLATLFPALDTERWLPDLAGALRTRSLAEAARSLKTKRVACADDALICMLADGHELALALDELSSNVARLRADTALIVLVSTRAPHERVQRWCDKLRRQLGPGRLGLATVADASLAFWSLAEIARGAGAMRFTFVGGDYLLTSAGWDAVARQVDGVDALPRYLPVERSCLGRLEVANDHQAFQWRTEAFASWIAQATFLPGRPSGLHGLPAAPGPAAGHVLARQIRQRSSGPTEARVHAALLRRHALAALHAPDAARGDPAP